MDAAWEGSREDDSSFAAEAPDHLLRYFANQAWLQEQELLNRQITPHTELPPPSEGEMERVLTALMGTALRPQSAATPSHSETKLDESRMQDQMLAMFQSKRVAKHTGDGGSKLKRQYDARQRSRDARGAARLKVEREARRHDLLQDNGGPLGFGVDHSTLALVLQCKQCDAGVDVQSYARALCRYLDRNVGRDALSLRFPLALREASRRAVAHESVVCPRCNHWEDNAPEFRAEQECILSRLHYDRLCEWFGANVMERPS